MDAALQTGVGSSVARPELGIKRQCQNCGSKFYDLARSPIVCPKCGTTFQVVAVTPSAVARPRSDVAAPADVAGDDMPDREAGDIELVSLEDADEEASGGKNPGAGDDLEIEDEIDDAAEDEFLEEDGDEDDVSDLIDGDLADDEET